MSQLPYDAFELCQHPGFRPSARRSLQLYGAPIDLVWLPERAARRGRPKADRPAFLDDPAPRILAEETLWDDDLVALTPNPYPFAEQHLLLWSKQPSREATQAMLEKAFAFAAQREITVLLNSMGAAASMTRAHIHLLGGSLPFLAALPRRDATEAWLEGLGGAVIHELDTPFRVVVIEGPPLLRAAAARQLLDRRTTPSFNLCDDGLCSYLLPRSRIEVTAPHFPQALGAAELWGRWCFNDRDAFDAATPASLDKALRLGGVPR